MKKSRVVISAAMLLAGSLVITACSAEAKPEPTEAAEVTGSLHIGKFGGSLGEAMLSIVPEFEAKYPGVTVTNEDTNSPQLVTTLIAGRNQADGAFDLVNLSPPAHLQAVMAGILEELDTNEVPMLAEMPKTDDPGYATLGFFRLGLAYNEEQLKANDVEPPASWDDLWNPEYEGHIIIGTIPGGGNQQAFFDYLWETEGSMEKAEAKFGELIPSVKAFVNSQPELESAIGSGDAWVTIASDTRSNLVAATGAPVKWVAPEPGALDWPMFFDVPKNSTNKAAAYAFIDFMLEKAQQEKMSDAGFFSPVNPEAKLSDKVKGLVGEAKDRANLRPINWQRIIDKLPDINRWWTETVG